MDKNDTVKLAIRFGGLAPYTRGKGTPFAYTVLLRPSDGNEQKDPHPYCGTFVRDDGTKVSTSLSDLPDYYTPDGAHDLIRRSGLNYTVQRVNNKYYVDVYIPPVEQEGLEVGTPRGHGSHKTEATAICNALLEMLTNEEKR